MLGVVFIVALAASATLFLRGDLGRWNDEYFFLRQFERDAPAGELDAPMPVRSWVLEGRLHFWRPLYRYAFTPVLTAVYQQPIAVHVLAACGHMGVSLGLWAFLRSFGAGRTAAGIAALGFLVYPAHFEGAFWSPCMPTPFATGLMLGALWMQARWTRTVDHPPVPESRRRVAFALTPAALAFAACCLNEQPAFITATMPLVVWNARASCSGAWVGVPRRARWWLLLTPALLAGGAVLTYMIIARVMYPEHTGRAAVETVPMAGLWPRLRQFSGDVVAWQGLRRFGSGAWREGRWALAEQPVVATAVVGLLVFAGIGWAWLGGKAAWNRARDEAEGAQEDGKHRGRGAALVALGVGVFLAGWGPLALIRYPVSSRLAYVPDAGLAIAIAGVLEIALGGSVARPIRHIAARAAALPVLIVWAVMMIGIQHAYRARWLADEREGAALHRLVPDPATKPRPVFMPVRVADRPVHSRAAAFDSYFVSPLLSEWAAGWWLQLHYRRSDVVCVRGSSGSAGEEPSLGWLDARTVQSRFRLVPPARLAIRSFGVGQIVPFEVDENGDVALYTHIALEGAASDGPMLLPMAADAFEQGRAPRRVLVIPRTIAEPRAAEGAPPGA